MVRSTEFYIPLTETVDVEGEIKKLRDELTYTQGFHNSVKKKLSNERFVNNAPEAVVAGERKKLLDAENKIKVITDQVAALQG